VAEASPVAGTQSSWHYAADPLGLRRRGSGTRPWAGRPSCEVDSGFIYQTDGFGYAMELEMLREAGLTPLEIIKAATADGAKTLYEPKGVKNQPIGTVEPGKLADLVIAPENPLANLKTPYATGHVRLDEQTNEVERVGGVRWTVKDGIVYDAERLRADVRAMVDEQQAAGARTARAADAARQVSEPADTP